MSVLDNVLQDYATVRDALRVTARVVTSGSKGIIQDKHRTLYSVEPATVVERIEAAQKELELLTVFSLVAAFERVLRELVVEVIQDRFRLRNEFEAKIEEQLISDAEFWKFSQELVEAFVLVPENLRGQVKQLIYYRDWVAHGKRWSNESTPRAQMRL